MSSLAAYLATAKGDRSIDEIAKRATDAGFQISRSVVAKYLRGEHGPRPPERTLEGLAAGFGVDVRKLRVLAGRPAGEQGAYTPIPESASLTQEQRKALDELIRVIVSGRSTDELADQAQKSPEPDDDGGSVVFPWLTAGPIAARRDLHGKKPRSDGERNA